MKISEEIQQRLKDVTKVLGKEGTQLVAESTHHLKEGELVELLEVVPTNLILRSSPLNQHVECLLQLDVIHLQHQSYQG